MEDVNDDYLFFEQLNGYLFGDICVFKKGRNGALENGYHRCLYLYAAKIRYKPLSCDVGHSTV
jgi:hypothetical protein